MGLRLRSSRLSAFPLRLTGSALTPTADPGGTEGIAHLPDSIRHAIWRQSDDLRSRRRYYLRAGIPSNSAPERGGDAKVSASHTAKRSLAVTQPACRKGPREIEWRTCRAPCISDGGVGRKRPRSDLPSGSGHSRGHRRDTSSATRSTRYSSMRAPNRCMSSAESSRPRHESDRSSERCR